MRKPSTTWKKKKKQKTPVKEFASYQKTPHIFVSKNILVKDLAQPILASSS